MAANASGGLPVGPNMEEALSQNKHDDDHRGHHQHDHHGHHQDGKGNNPPTPNPPPVVDANQSLTFTQSDFTWVYAKGDPPADANLSPQLAALAAGKYGYNSNNDGPFDPLTSGTPQADHLNASFFNYGGFSSTTLTFHQPGDTQSFMFGFGALQENTIVARPFGVPGAEDFSYPVDPSHPEELNIELNVNVLGIPNSLHFLATPQVTSGPQLSIIQNDPSSPYFAEVQGLLRTGPPNAPLDLPGGFRDPDRFLAHFSTQEFMVGNNKYLAKLEDLKFDAYSDPSVPAATTPNNPHNPIEFQPAILTITLETIG
jgi:hypothetical protein